MVRGKVGSSARKGKLSRTERLLGAQAADSLWQYLRRLNHTHHDLSSLMEEPRTLLSCLCSICIC